MSLPLTRAQRAKLGFDVSEAVSLDVQPGACPNPLGVNKKGVVSVAILGTTDLDVRQIDVASLALQGVPVLRYGYEDVAEPAAGDLCACTEAGPDGFEDLTLKFEGPEILGALAPVDKGDDRVLGLTGQLRDGTPIEATDCVVLGGMPE
jgi:hypothetical protein